MHAESNCKIDTLHFSDRARTLVSHISGNDIYYYTNEDLPIKKTLYGALKIFTLKKEKTIF